MFKVIDGLKNRLDQKRPLSDLMSKNLQEDLILRGIYHSNSIEGYAIKLLETKVVFEGIALGVKN